MVARRTGAFPAIGDDPGRAVRPRQDAAGPGRGRPARPHRTRPAPSATAASDRDRTAGPAKTSGPKTAVQAAARPRPAAPRSRHAAHGSVGRQPGGSAKPARPNRRMRQRQPARSTTAPAPAPVTAGRPAGTPGPRSRPRRRPAASGVWCDATDGDVPRLNGPSTSPDLPPRPGLRSRRHAAHGAGHHRDRGPDARQNDPDDDRRGRPRPVALPDHTAGTARHTRPRPRAPPLEQAEAAERPAAPNTGRRERSKRRAPKLTSAERPGPGSASGAPERRHRGTRDTRGRGVVRQRRPGRQ